MKSKSVRRLSFDEQKSKCREFIQNFEDYDSNFIHDIYGRKKYLIAMQQLADEQSKCLEIVFQDLESYFRKEEEQDLLEMFKKNTARYIQIFSEIAEELTPIKLKQADDDQEIRNRFENILKDQRNSNWKIQNSADLGDYQQVPLCINKSYDVAIVYGPNSKIKPKAVSDLTADEIGSLVMVKAIVLRTSEIKPQLTVATYICDLCGCENYMQIFDNTYMPLDKCMSKKCIDNKVNGKLTFLPSNSKFRSIQYLKIQETPDQLRDGRIPRTYPLTLRESQIKTASPGDVIIIQGILLPRKNIGGRYYLDLAFECHLEAVKIIRQKKKYLDISLSTDQKEEIQAVRASLDDESLFLRLAASIAPEIYGLETVKKALLLLMAGGVTKQTHDNLKIRGEINIALIGDPGIAKSQLLKHISYLAPRAIYTSGKGSSDVGLTAAVVIDAHTRQVSLEAGALVLADMGICCIDQFDKMEQYDRTAIHEVMEQQTVSIAKAGITTSLNARTSILAAANPLYGRYNKNETFHKNVNLPAALLSRFDIIFILLDQKSIQRDIALAKHIGMVHKSQTGLVNSELFTPEFLRAYISLSKTFSPTISVNLQKMLIDKYIMKRQDQVDLVKEGDSYTTTRTLLATIRLCQARAKLRFSNEVNEEDVIECLQIVQKSQQNLRFDQQMRRPMHDYTSQIFTILKEMCNYSKSKSVNYQQFLKRVLLRGFKEDQMDDTIDKYMELNVIMKDSNSIILVGG